jgi:hypothetical protein
MAGWVPSCRYAWTRRTDQVTGQRRSAELAPRRPKRCWIDSWLWVWSGADSDGVGLSEPIRELLVAGLGSDRLARPHSMLLESVAVGLPRIDQMMLKPNTRVVRAGSRAALPVGPRDRTHGRRRRWWCGRSWPRPYLYWSTTWPLDLTCVFRRLVVFVDEACEDGSALDSLARSREGAHLGLVVRCA